MYKLCLRCLRCVLLAATLLIITAVATVAGVAAKDGPRSLQVLNTEVDVCYNFTNGDRNKGEFYSPFYPMNYPNNTECTALITGTVKNNISNKFIIIQLSFSCKSFNSANMQFEQSITQHAHACQAI